MVIEDSESRDLHYLATVTDVREKGLLPTIDQRALEEVYTRILGDASIDRQAAVEALRELILSGAQRQFGLREVDLRILGEIHREGSRLRVSLHRRPPRPYSVVREADNATVNDLLAHDCRFMVLGEHYVIGGALVTLDPSRLNMHLAVVGQTGSGKTETVKRIALEYYVRAEPPKTLIVFDVAGEYLGYPYKAPGAIPLFHALLRPDKYVCEPRPKCAGKLNLSPPPRATILVPYSASKIGAKKRNEELYFAKYQRLVQEVSSDVAEAGRAPVRFVAFGRHSAYTLDEHGRARKISLREAWRSILEDENLVVAAPAPDALSIDEIIDLSGTQSEYAPVLISAAANALGLLELDVVTSVTLLQGLLDALLSLLVSMEKENALKRFSNAGKQIANTLKNIAEGNKSVWALVDVVKSSLGEGIYILTPALLYYATLPAWRRWDPDVLESHGVAEPFDVEDPRVIRAALESKDPDLDIKWREALPARIAEFARVVSRYSSGTIASAARALRKVSFMVSPVLNYDLYRVLVSRLLGEGVTLVLLAPPSTGAAELPVARLLQTVFDVAVDMHDPSAPRSTLLVVEEAHNLAPSKGDPPTKRWLVRIAREGRKWGVGLVLVTQRPGFVDPDVLSQAASLVALRVTNPEDISGLRRSVESTSAEMAERLPDLDQGQALVSGMAVPERRVPLAARIVMLGDHCPSAGASGGEAR